MQSAARLAPVVLLTSLMLACGGKQPEPATPTGEATPAPATDPGAPSTTEDLAADAGAGSALPPADGPKGEAGRRAEDIQAAVKAKRPTARACYDEAQKKTPTLEGDITIAWTIDPQGKITEARVDPTGSTITDETLGKCLVAVIQTLSFPASAGGKETRARYPFNFHPKSKASNTGF